MGKRVCDIGVVWVFLIRDRGSAMKVGKRKAGSCSHVLVERTKKTLEYALCRLSESVLSPYITNVYLYGSCARGEQTYKSDVDLLVEFSEDIDPIKCGPDIIQLKGDISPSSLEFPEVDMHVVIGDGWRNSKKLYHQNVRREGIEIWGTQKIHT